MIDYNLSHSFLALIPVAQFIAEILLLALSLALPLVLGVLTLEPIVDCIFAFFDWRIRRRKEID